jgi:hypothetical protein
LAENELGQTALELVALQKCAIDYLGAFQELLQQITEHFPSECERIKAANTSKELDKAYSAIEPLLPKLSPKQKQERTRRHKWSMDGMGLIEWDFGDRREALLRRDPILSLIPSQLRTLGPTCLDDIFIGATVGTKRLQELFGMHRNRFGKVPPVSRGRYGWTAVLTIMDRLLGQDASASKMPGRPLRAWPSDPKVRLPMVRAIEARLNTFPMPEHIRVKFLTLVRRYLPDSVKK